MSAQSDSRLSSPVIGHAISATTNELFRQKCFSGIPVWNLPWLDFVMSWEWRSFTSREANQVSTSILVRSSNDPMTCEWSSKWPVMGSSQKLSGNHLCPHELRLSISHSNPSTPNISVTWWKKQKVRSGHLNKFSKHKPILLPFIISESRLGSIVYFHHLKILIESHEFSTGRLDNESRLVYWMTFVIKTIPLKVYSNS